jgi:hypothetical protein
VNKKSFAFLLKHKSESSCSYMEESIQKMTKTHFSTKLQREKGKKEIKESKIETEM